MNPQTIVIGDTQIRLLSTIKGLVSEAEIVESEIKSFSPIDSTLLSKVKTTSVEDYEYIIEKAEEAFFHFRKTELHESHK